MKTTYKILKLEKIYDPEFPDSEHLAVHFVTLEKTISILGFPIKTTTIEIYRTNNYWKHKDTGACVRDTEVNDLINAYLVYQRVKPQ